MTLTQLQKRSQNGVSISDVKTRTTLHSGGSYRRNGRSQRKGRLAVENHKNKHILILKLFKIMTISVQDREIISFEKGIKHIPLEQIK